METESGRSSIRGNIYFGAVAAGIYTDEYIYVAADLVGIFGSKVSAL